MIQCETRRNMPTQSVATDLRQKAAVLIKEPSQSGICSDTCISRPVVVYVLLCKSLKHRIQLETPVSIRVLFFSEVAHPSSLQVACKAFDSELSAG